MLQCTPNKNACIQLLLQGSPVALFPPRSYLAGTAKAGSQPCQHLNHSFAAVALQSIERLDAGQGLEEVQMFLHHILEICHKKGFLASLEKRKESQEILTQLFLTCCSPFGQLSLKAVAFFLGSVHPLGSGDPHLATEPSGAITISQSCLPSQGSSEDKTGSSHITQRTFLGGRVGYKWDINSNLCTPTIPYEKLNFETCISYTCTKLATLILCDLFCFCKRKGETQSVRKGPEAGSLP